jgi:uncharacterized protein (UPF0262 family)
MPKSATKAKSKNASSAIQIKEVTLIPLIARTKSEIDFLDQRAIISEFISHQSIELANPATVLPKSGCNLSIARQENNFQFDFHDGDKSYLNFSLAFLPLRSILRDYFRICQSFQEMTREGGCARLEAVDMGRRGLHNEAAEQLQETLQPHIKIDFVTARYLFSLLCLLSDELLG